MEPTTPPQGMDSTDPREQLRVLDQVQTATQIDPSLNFGPAWWAPALAALIAGAVATSSSGILADQGWATTLVLVAAIAMLMGVMLTQRVRVRRSPQQFLINFGGALLGIGLMVAWMVIQSALDWTGWAAVAELVVGWLIVTGLFLLLRRWMQHRRAKAWGHQ